MARKLTIRFPAALALALLSACSDDAPSESEGLDGGRDASTADGGRDGAAPGLDASDAQALDAQLRDAQLTDAQVDAQVDASQALLETRLAQLSTSRAKWRELAAASPGPYWYADENCVLNGIKGQVSKIQVEPPTSRVYEEATIARADCEVHVNRYSTRITSSGGTETLDQLYDVCESQLRRLPASTFTLDSRGVIKACFSSTAENCFDACGSGFYLRDWQFGAATPTPDGGLRNDGGVYTDAGVRTDAGT